MARISCEVRKCEYNCDGGCKLPAIKVDGKDAHTSKETVCESYTDRAEKGVVNCNPNECACNNAKIECGAKECKYNEEYCCTADRINVGCEDSCCCSETECKTFIKK